MKLTKNLFYVIALALSVVMVVVGIVFLCLGTSHTGAGGGLSRASTSVEFGADYYTYSVQYAGLAANALCDIFVMLKCAFGAFFILFGGLNTCYTLSKILKNASAKKQDSATNEEIKQESTPESINV